MHETSFINSFNFYVSYIKSCDGSLLKGEVEYMVFALYSWLSISIEWEVSS